MWVKGQRNKQSWLSWVIIQRQGVVSYTVRVQDEVWRRHVNHLRKGEALSWKMRKINNVPIKKRCRGT